MIGIFGSVSRFMHNFKLKYSSIELYLRYKNDGEVKRSWKEYKEDLKIIQYILKEQNKIYLLQAVNKILENKTDDIKTIREYLNIESPNTHQYIIENLEQYKREILDEWPQEKSKHETYLKYYKETIKSTIEELKTQINLIKINIGSNDDLESLKAHQEKIEELYKSLSVKEGGVQLLYFNPFIQKDQTCAERYVIGGFDELSQQFNDMNNNYHELMKIYKQLEEKQKYEKLIRGNETKFREDRMDFYLVSADFISTLQEENLLKQKAVLTELNNGLQLFINKYAGKVIYWDEESQKYKLIAEKYNIRSYNNTSDIQRIEEISLSFQEVTKQLNIVNQKLNGSAEKIVNLKKQYKEQKQQYKENVQKLSKLENQEKFREYVPTGQTPALVLEYANEELNRANGNLELFNRATNRARVSAIITGGLSCISVVITAVTWVLVSDVLLPVMLGVATCFLFLKACSYKFTADSNAPLIAVAEKSKREAEPKIQFLEEYIKVESNVKTLKSKITKTLDEITKLEKAAKVSDNNLFIQTLTSKDKKLFLPENKPPVNRLEISVAL